ncbi:MAG: hypothetical protein GOMPHAMPRED_007289 [Gomphillus americanus]|uniref:SGNH hydrolase-type esterase domain-containing protein n=1 Tax=Gomphillus americanus TaxID=1940652 RepID=A0A8H3I883_9LECA|nr:MAG: hypothetical protein GOMPHAMPRED_007289 [Gomphillus americanus]
MQFLSILPALLSLASALPTSIISRDANAALFQSKNLHILPLGASITYGYHSSDGNGYRETLRNLLSPAAVTYVGSQCSGSMSNANNEGHPGWLVGNMQGVATQDLPQKPNVVLIYVGTNDMIFGNAAQAPSDMQKLVTYLTTNLPDSLIVVSKLFLNADPAVQARIEKFNAQLSTIQWPANVVLADLSSALLHSDLGPDGIHPNDSGPVNEL